MPTATPYIPPLPYHGAIRDYLREEEAEVWKWFASNRVQKEHAESIRFDLLKRTYRIERDSKPELYEQLDHAAGALGIEAEVTLYQAQYAEGLNASLAYLPGEAHIVLEGPILEKLNDQELRALFGHELGHAIFNEVWDGDLLIVWQVLSAMTHDNQAEPSHFETARLFSLYTEVFCDRLATRVLDGDIETVIGMLVKIATGLEQVDAKGYLRQAREILAKEPTSSEQATHPEQYLRARVLELWDRDPEAAEPLTEELIQGKAPLERLDFITRKRLAFETRQLIDAFFTPSWTRTDLLLSHARLFFDRYEPTTDQTDILRELRDSIAGSHSSVQDYFCYTLMDFASADRDLEEAPLAHTLCLADRLGIGQRMGEIATKEFRLRKKQFEKIWQDREKLVSAAVQAEASV